MCAGNRNNCSGIEVDLTASVNKSGGRIVSRDVGPETRVEVGDGVVGENGGIRAEVNGATVYINNGAQGELGGGDGGIAFKLRQDAQDGALAHLDRAGLAIKERRAVGADGGALRIGHGIVACDQVDAAVEGDGGGAVDHAIDQNLATDEGGVAARGVDKAGVGDGAGVVAHRAHVGVETAQGGVVGTVGGDADLETGGEDGLAVRGEDGAVVLDVGPEERDASAGAGGIQGALQNRSGLNKHVAVAAQFGMRSFRSEAGHAVGAGGLGEAGEEELGVGVVKQAALDEVLVERDGGGGEAAGVHLAGAAEDDAVFVDDVNLAVGGKRAEDLGRGGGGVVDLVKYHPFGAVGTAGGLVEFEVGFLADVEGLPVKQGLRGGLGDADLDAAVGTGGLGREVGAVPAHGRAFGVELHGEAAGDETVGHVRQVGVQAVGAGQGGGSGGTLKGLDVPESASGARESVAGIDQDLITQGSRRGLAARGWATRLGSARASA